MIKPLSNIEVLDKARELITHLKGVNAYDAFRILNQSTTVLLEENNKPFKALLKQPVMPINPDFFIKKHQGIIENNPDIREFLFSLEPAMSYVKKANACEKKFGKDRAPRKSTVARYFLKMKKKYFSGDPTNEC